jgi:hypothetical protein
MKHCLCLGLVITAIGCKQEVASSVLCEIKEGPVVECSITQTKGTSEIEVCWHYKAECANKSTLEAPKMCAKVKDGGSTTASTPADKLTISGPCEGAAKGAVTNMTINGETAK